ncbi:MAG: hypothetical protein K2X66_05530, partial [Cyanobacteria bacterium]|nr:hypothetical protein [Cyanobacteriota bacterium]
MTTLGPNRGLMGNSIGGSATPQNQLVRVMSAIGRPGWKAILPLEGAVLAGRSLNEAKRSGWLGFQERFVEELVVAIIWLFGVKYIANQFDKFHKFDTAVDWSLKKANSIDLTPIERYTQNFAEGQGLLKMKGLRLGVSVGSTLFLLGVVIPWLNQMKTKWIINKFFGKHQPHAGMPPVKSGMNPTQNLRPTQSSPKLGAYDNHDTKKRSILDTEPSSPKRFYNPAPPAQQDWTQPNLPFNTSHPVSQAPYASQYNQPQYTQPQYYPPSYFPMVGSSPLPQFLYQEGQGNKAFNPLFTNTPSPQSAYPFIQNPMAPLQFGGLASLAKVGHWIENTDYGSILVTDLGITSGRAVVATKRSPFEALEIIFRDGLSMYFYILCVPHISRLLNRFINPILNRSTLLDPYAAKELDQEILKGALQATKGADAIHFDALKKVILGDPQWEKVFVNGANGKYHEGIEALFDAMRTAPVASSGPSGNSFLSLLEKETIAHFPQDPTRASALLQGLQASIQGKQTLHVNETAQLLKDIESGSGAFKALNLTAAEQGNLVRVVKQAFRHAVGIDKETLLSLQPFKNLMDSLTPEEQAAVQVRIQKMAQKDARDLNNSILRRILNITKGITPASGSTLAHKLSQGEELAQWMEKSASRSVSLETVVQDEIQGLLTQLTNPKTKLPTMNPSQQAAFSQLKEILTQQKLSSGSHSFKEVAELLTHANQKAMAQK